MAFPVLSLYFSALHFHSNFRTDVFGCPTIIDPRVPLHGWNRPSDQKGDHRNQGRTVVAAASEPRMMPPANP